MTTIPETRTPDPSAYRRRIVEPVRAGRSSARPVEEFEASEQAIRKGERQTDFDEGTWIDGHTLARGHYERRWSATCCPASVRSGLLMRP